MNSELGRRVVFTLGALLVFRIGSHIPLPGIDPAVWGQLFRSSRMIQTFDASSGGAIGRLSIFALGITPYVSAAILVQVIGLFFHRYRLLLNGGRAGRKRIQAYTRALTVVIALVQGYGIATAMSGIDGLVVWPAAPFILAVTLTLVASSLFLMWLADQITDRGVGNGIALFLCVGIVMSLPQGIAQALELMRQGMMSPGQMVAVAGIGVLLVAFVAFMELARRDVAVTYRSRAGSEATSYLTLKLNSAGLVPSLIAGWVIALPLVAALVASFALGTDPAGWENLRLALQQGQPLYMLCFAPLVFFCVYLYTAFVVDPNDAAEKLQRLGGLIPQIAPGEPTAEYIDNVLSRVTFIGAVYFVAICLVPELLLYRFDLPFYLGGASVLMLVCTAIDIEKQARAFAPIA